MPRRRQPALGQNPDKGLVAIGAFEHRTQIAESGTRGQPDSPGLVSVGRMCETYAGDLKILSDLCGIEVLNYQPRGW